MYMRDQATAYPLGLHISRVTDVKIVADKVSPQIPIWDATKKKGFKCYDTEEMPSRQMKVEVFNYPRNWISLFNRNKLVRAPDAFDAKTFQNQIMWMNTLKTSTSGYDGSNNAMHHDVIQMLHLLRKYHFNDAYVCFTKDANNYSLIQHLLQPFTVQYEGSYNLKKMTEDQIIDHVTQLHDD